MMNELKIQNLPIMNAVMVSLTLHALAGWVFLNIARDLTNHKVAPPVEFFVVPPPPPEHMTPVAPQPVPKPAQKNAAAQHRQVPPPTPAAATRPVSESPAAPSPIKQKAEAPPPSLVPPIAASPQAKEPASLHSVPASAAATAVPLVSSAPAGPRNAASGNNDTGTVIGPSFDAGYLNNPVPPYPAIARKLKLQGTAVVRVLVSPEGQPKNVVLEKTSGVRVLDETAVETVKRWTFVPARRGNNRVAAWVDVPMTFHLK
jgi:periplasmic protein TonB